MTKIILGLTALGVLIYGLNAWFPKYIASKASGKAPACLEMLGSQMSDADAVNYIIGTLRNSCDSKISSATVLFKLERRAGPMQDMPEAVAYAYVRDLKSGETRQFKTALPVSRETSYRFDGINAW